MPRIEKVRIAEEGGGGGREQAERYSGLDLGRGGRRRRRELVA